MKIMGLWLLLSVTGPLWAGAPEIFRLPAFPLPTLAANGGEITEVTSVRLLRQLHQGGLSGFDGLETADGDYALFRSDSITRMAGWLERMCVSVDFDLRNARARPYDGTVFSRLLVVGTSLAVQRGRHSALAMPIGVVLCRRAEAWGDIKANGLTDAYVIFATDEGMFIYDPPTRQLSSLAEFPNKSTITQIRF